MAMSQTIYLAGHSGLVGSAIGRALARHGYAEPLVAELDELVTEMVAHDLAEARRDDLLRSGGFATRNFHE
jgi:nucleoside-diphosphate-sugar epimerase